MQNFLSLYEKLEQALAICLKYLLIYCLGALVLVVLWQVLSRYILRSSTGWTEELAEFALMWVSILGTAVLFREKAHLGVDFFVTRFKESVQKKIEWLVYLIIIFFVAYVMIGGSIILFEQAIASNQRTPVLRINRAYVYSVFMFCSISIFIFNLGHIMRLSYEMINNNSKSKSSSS